MQPTAVLFAGLIDDAAMFPPGNAALLTAVAEHADHRQAWYAPMIGPLVVTADSLTEISGTTTASALSVVNRRGAAGLAEVTDERVVMIETVLPDDNTPTDAATALVAAGRRCPAHVQLVVELPGNVAGREAAEIFAEAGWHGKLRTGGLRAGDVPSADLLARQLHTLVAVGLPFKLTAGLHHLTPLMRDGILLRHGILTVLLAIDALLAEADIITAAAILAAKEQNDPVAAVAGWDEARAAAVRQRWRSFGCCGVTEPIAELVAVGLLSGRDA